MCVQDIAFLPSKLDFPLCFLKILVEVKASGQLCLKTAVVNKQGHAPSKYFYSCKIFLLPKSIFLCKPNLVEIIWLMKG